jgi:hypothetical protein
MANAKRLKVPVGALIFFLLLVLSTITVFEVTNVKPLQSKQVEASPRSSNPPIPTPTQNYENISKRIAHNEPLLSSAILPSSVLLQSEQRGYKIHHIHIPKCGGTSMTTILRAVMCLVDPIKNADCCLNPGFCDHFAQRKCSVIKGCINHFPNRYVARTSIGAL